MDCSLSCVLKNKGVPWYLAAFPQLLRRCRSRWQCGSADATGQNCCRTSLKIAPRLSVGLHSKSCSRKIGAWTGQEAGSQESLIESPRLPWIHSVGITWAFCNFTPASFVECLTGSEPRIWMNMITVFKIFQRNGLLCVCECGHVQYVCACGVHMYVSACGMYVHVCVVCVCERWEQREKICVDNAIIHCIYKISII